MVLVGGAVRFISRLQCGQKVFFSTFFAEVPDEEDPTSMKKRTTTTTTIITAPFEELSVVGFARAAAMVLIVSIGFSPFPMNTPGLSHNTCVPVALRGDDITWVALQTGQKKKRVSNYVLYVCMT